jgi:hypothetical protein
MIRASNCHIIQEVVD